MYAYPHSIVSRTGAPGTTPPQASCSSACEAMASPRIVPSLRTTATPVSSQLVSMPSTVKDSPSDTLRAACITNPPPLPTPSQSMLFGSPTNLRAAISGRTLRGRGGGGEGASASLARSTNLRAAISGRTLRGRGGGGEGASASLARGLVHRRPTGSRVHRRASGGRIETRPADGRYAAEVPTKSSDARRYGMRLRAAM